MEYWNGFLGNMFHMISHEYFNYILLTEHCILCTPYIHTSQIIYSDRERERERERESKGERAE